MKRARVAFAVLILASAAGALAVRLPRLALRPMHCDEANQAVKAGRLWQQGEYRYDPYEHHGPTLNWFTLPSLWLGSAKTFAETAETTYRIVPVVFGVGVVLLVVLVADGLGWPAAIVAAVLTAISPAMTFYSRYYIHETLLVFFTLATIGCGWRYARSGSLGWAMATGTSLGLMFATKETWILAAAAMAASLLIAGAWSHWFHGQPVGPDENRASAQATPGSQAAIAAPISARYRVSALLAAAACACLVATAFFSSFGTHWHGVIDSLTAYTTYWTRGGEGGIHAHPWYYYLRLLTAFRPARGFFWSEGLIVGLAVVGVVAALCRRGLTEPQQTFGRFLAIYTLLLAGLYAAVPYKTPWCMLSSLNGMILLAGVGAAAIVRWLPGRPLKSLACLLLAAGVGHLGWEMYALNFRFYADQRNPYVYAHTSSDAVNLAAQIDRLTQNSAEAHDMEIHVVTPENYWPLPWYLRRFHVGYWADAAAWARETAKWPPPAVIIFTPDIQTIVNDNLRAAYPGQMIYGLRPGVLLMVYVRADL